MAATQSQRAALYTNLTALMDEQAADTLMDQLPPGGWDQMATKDGLAGCESRLLAALATATAETHTKLAGVDSKFAGVDSKFAGVDGKFAGVDGKLAETNAAMQVGFAMLQATIATGLAEAAKERAEIVRSQARQMYVVLAAGAAATISIWIALFTAAGGA